MHFVKNFFLLIILSVIAYHVDAKAQIIEKYPTEKLSRLLFLTDNTLGGTNLNRIDNNRSTLSSQELTPLKIMPGSVSWTNMDSTRLLSYSILSEDKSIDLKLAIINTKPQFSLKTFSLPENLKNEYSFKKWIAKNANQTFAANHNSVYLLSFESSSQNKATLIHTLPTDSLDSNINVLSFDSKMQNLIFSYTLSNIIYSYNLEKKTISSLTPSAFCKGKIHFFNNQLTPMGESNFLVYCTSTTTQRAAFLLLDFSKLVVTRYETKEEFTAESDFTVDSSGFFTLFKKMNSRTAYCSGNIKQISNFQCFGASMLIKGFVFATQSPAQFYMINSNNLFFLDFKTGTTRRTSVMFTAPLSGNVINPVSI